MTAEGPAETDSITIRLATPADAAEVASVFVSAFPGLFRFAYGLAPQEAGAVLGDLYRREVLWLGDTHLAMIGATVTGFATLRRAVRSHSPEARAYWRVLAARLGPVRALRAMAGTLILAVIFSGRSPRGDTAYLDTLAVAEPLRGRGIGSRLLAHVESLATENACTSIALHVVRANDGARRLYQRHGFRALPDERVLPRMLNAVTGGRGTQLMVKRLGGE